MKSYIAVIKSEEGGLRAASLRAENLNHAKEEANDIAKWESARVLKVFVAK